MSRQANAVSGEGEIEVEDDTFAPMEPDFFIGTVCHTIPSQPLQRSPVDLLFMNLMVVVHRRCKGMDVYHMSLCSLESS
jgi:hypothetical protein